MIFSLNSCPARLMCQMSRFSLVNIISTGGNMAFLNDWNFWLSLVTVVIATVAIFQTQRQVKISNKQSLFDRRINSYTIMFELVQTYERNQSDLLLQQNNHQMLFVDLEFIWLTNTPYLYPIQKTILNPSQEPDHMNFIRKCGELKELAEISQLIFEGKDSVLMSDFILAYEQFLFEMYKYQITRNEVEEYARKFSSTLEQARKALNEKVHQQKVMTSYNELKEAYDNIEKYDVLEEIKKQMRF